MFETRLLANRLIANQALGYEPTEIELGWHVLDQVIPYIEFLESKVSQLAYTLESIHTENMKGE
jgi:hypothetical protein